MGAVGHQYFGEIRNRRRRHRQNPSRRRIRQTHGEWRRLVCRFYRSPQAERFSRNKAGTLLIVDYPEENRGEVAGLLETVANPAECSKLRILFLTRYPLDSWLLLIDEANPGGIFDMKPVRPGAMPEDDAYKIFTSTQENASEYLVTVPRPFSQALFEIWFDSAPSHQRALFNMAAAVHSALYPESNTLEFEGREVMLAIVRRERVRLRGIAKELGFPHEDGLAAALITDVFAEHDNQAPEWLWAGIEDDIKGGIGRLGRLIYDAEEVLDLPGAGHPRVSGWLETSVEGNPGRCAILDGPLRDFNLPINLVETALTVRKTMVTQAANDEERVDHLNSLSIDLGCIGRWKAALDASQEAVNIYRGLADYRLKPCVPSWQIPSTTFQIG